MAGRVDSSIFSSGLLNASSMEGHMYAVQSYSEKTARKGLSDCFGKVSDVTQTLVVI